MNVCTIRICKNYVLLVYNSERNGWEFPGGKVDYEKDGEEEIIDITKSGLREYVEEVGGGGDDLLRSSKVYMNHKSQTLFLVYLANDFLLKQRCIVKDVTNGDVITKYAEFPFYKRYGEDDTESLGLLNEEKLSFPDDVKFLKEIQTDYSYQQYIANFQ